MKRRGDKTRKQTKKRTEKEKWGEEKKREKKRGEENKESSPDSLLGIFQWWICPPPPRDGSRPPWGRQQEGNLCVERDREKEKKKKKNVIELSLYPLHFYPHCRLFLFLPSVCLPPSLPLCLCRCEMLCGLLVLDMGPVLESAAVA